METTTVIKFKYSSNPYWAYDYHVSSFDEEETVGAH